MNKITIGSVGGTTTYNVDGKNIRVKTNNNKNSIVMVNGVVIEDGISGDITIKFEGDLANLDCTNADIYGDVKGDIDGTNITVKGSVGGSVDGTNITVGANVGGGIDGSNVTVKNNFGGFKL